MQLSRDLLFLKRLHFQLNYRSKATHSTSTCAAGRGTTTTQSSNNCITPKVVELGNNGIRKGIARHLESDTPSAALALIHKALSHTQTFSLPHCVFWLCWQNRRVKAAFQHFLALSLPTSPSTYTESFPEKKQNLPQLLPIAPRIIKA